MIVLVTGGRHFSDGSYLFDQMDRLHAEHNFTMVVEGGQRSYRKGERRPSYGADFFAHEWAVLRGILVRTEYARWNDLSQPDARIMQNRRGEPYDANAGPRRNGLMLEKYRPEMCVAFHPSGTGTKNMLDQARVFGLEPIELRAEA